MTSEENYGLGPDPTWGDTADEKIAYYKWHDEYKRLWRENLSPLEKKYLETKEAVTKEINEKLEIASKAISEATQLAEEHGISFDANVSPLSQVYRAASFEEKWPELDKSWSKDFPEYGGWEYSAVCY